jgi:HNH endonuclease
LVASSSIEHPERIQATVVAGVVLSPGAPLMASGYDWSWAYVIHRPAPGLLGYCVGSDATFWSRRIGGRPVRLAPAWRQKRSSFSRNPGYFFYSLRVVGGHRGRKYVHRLVLETFIGPCPPGMECRHLNGNCLNNSLRNLCWGTSQANSEDTKRHGRQMAGSRFPHAKLKEADIPDIRRLYAEGWLQCQLARFFDVSECMISLVLHGKRWKHVPEEAVIVKTPAEPAGGLLPDVQG